MLIKIRLEDDTIHYYNVDNLFTSDFEYSGNESDDSDDKAHDATTFSLPIKTEKNKISFPEEVDPDNKLNILLNLFDIDTACLQCRESSVIERKCLNPYGTKFYSKYRSNFHYSML